MISNLCAVTRTNRMVIESRKVRVNTLQFSEQKTSDVSFPHCQYRLFLAFLFPFNLYFSKVLSFFIALPDLNLFRLTKPVVRFIATLLPRGRKLLFYLFVSFRTNPSSDSGVCQSLELQASLQLQLYNI